MSANTAYHGNLEFLKYLHENGCPWDKSTCEFAAKSGHLDCLKYAHENGCPWDHETCKCINIYGNIVNSTGINIMIMKSRKNTLLPKHLELLKNKMAKIKNFKMCLDYIHKNGCPCDCLNNKS